MKLGSTKYEIGDCLLISGTQLEIERVLTVSSIRIDVFTEYRETKVVIWYGFKESMLMYKEEAVIKKVTT